MHLVDFFVNRLHLVSRDAALRMIHYPHSHQEMQKAQVKDLRQQAAGGWALYRYGSLFGPEAPALAEAECAALRALNG